MAFIPLFLVFELIFRQVHLCSHGPVNFLGISFSLLLEKSKLNYLIPDMFHFLLVLIIIKALAFFLRNESKLTWLLPFDVVLIINRIFACLPALTSLFSRVAESKVPETVTAICCSE